MIKENILFVIAYKYDLDILSKNSIPLTTS